MGRVKLSIAILLLILSYSITSTFIIKHSTDKLIGAIEDTQQLVDQGKEKEAIESMDRLYDISESYDDIASIFIRSDKTSGIPTSLARIKPLIKKDNDEVHAELESLKALVKWIYKSERPVYSNIL